MKNRRFNDRQPVSATVAVTPLSGDDAGVTFECTVADYSAEGIGLRTNRVMILYEQIRVAIGKDKFIGTVRHCKKSPHGFYSVGVKLKPEESLQVTSVS